MPRLRRTQLVRVLTELFGELAEPARAEIECQLEWVQLDGGGLLFREGDVSDDVYVVMNGRLRVVTSDADGRERVLEEVGRGAAVGEVALLTGEPRSATVFAVRDSYLLRLSKRAFDQLIDRYPRAMMQVARAAVWRLRRRRQRLAEAPARPRSRWSRTPGVPLAAFARRLVDQLRLKRHTLPRGSADVDRLLGKPGIAQTGEDTIVHESIVAWLSGQERDHGSLVLEADPEWSAEQTLRAAGRSRVDRRRRAR